MKNHIVISRATSGLYEPALPGQCRSLPTVRGYAIGKAISGETGYVLLPNGTLEVYTPDAGRRRFKKSQYRPVADLRARNTYEIKD